MAERIFYRKTYQKNKKVQKFLRLLKILGGCFLSLILLSLFLFIYYAKDLPRPEKFTEKQSVQSAKIYDRSGEILLYEIFGEEKRTVVAFDKIPDYLKQAVITAEDANFYHHFGVDLKGMARSILINLKIKEPIYGGSTIPQQLIRSVFFSPEKTAERKVREIILSLELDRRYPKDQILGWYLNQVPFGSNCYGVEAASQTYFGKTISEISLPEAATLAALIKAPTYLSPYGDAKDELINRKNYILDRMADKNFITKTEAEKAKNEEVKFADVLTPIKAPHFALYVKDYLLSRYGEDFIKERGIKVYTSLDWELQSEAEIIVKEGVQKNRVYNAYNGALVAIDPKTGEVLAMVGSADWFGNSYPEKCTPGLNCLFDPRFNAAIGTKKNPGRQPGSSFKPFVYVTAFMKGYTDKALINDEKTNFGIWGDEEYIPQNYDGKFRGMVNLRQSLAQSLNIPSIKVLYLAGSDDKIDSLATNNFTGEEGVLLNGLAKSIETAKKMGITTLNKPLSSYGPAIVLGGGEVKLLEMVSAYGVFATEGLQTSPVFILKIEDSRGNIIEENKKTLKRVLEKNPCRLVNDILSDNEARTPIFGSRSPLYFENYQVAVKTGTTQNYRDGWVIGYTPSATVGVWVGNNDNSPMLKEPGIVVAGPIWRSFMEKILLKYPKENFEKPVFSLP